MSRPATARLKVNPVLGSMPVLQYCSPDQLQIDESYQRSLDAGGSQALIRRIAVHWDWGLCQPLFVARRGDGVLYVVDGQHRLAAAKLRGDIWQLPCVVASFEDGASEAAAFVALNQQRRPLSKLQLFKAAVASGDPEALTIVRACEDAGLRISSSSNLDASPPGSLSNIGGLQNCLRVHGEAVLSAALDVLAQSYKDQALRLAGTIFPGIVAIVAIELQADAGFADGELFALMTEMVGGAAQEEWAKDVYRLVAEADGINRRTAAIDVFERAWRECNEALLDEAA
jgi:hypothetical protein